jgi:hypothetical protein
MADKAEDSGQRAGGPERARRESRARLLTAGRVRAALAVTPRLILLFVIVWAFTGPIDRVPTIVGAASLVPAAAPADSTVRAAPVLQETGFAVADGPIGKYFAARGGVRTFGPPVSNAFPLLGSTVQIFRDHVLKLEPNGSVTTVNLFALGAIPFRNVGGAVGSSPTSTRTWLRRRRSPARLTTPHASRRSSGRPCPISGRTCPSGSTRRSSGPCVPRMPSRAVARRRS